MSTEPTEYPEAVRVFIQPLIASDDNPTDWVPGAWEHIGIVASGDVTVTWDGLGDLGDTGDDMAWNLPPDWKTTATTHTVIDDGHPDTLFESADYPMPAPGFQAITPYTCAEEAFMRVVTLKDVTHTVTDTRGGLMGTGVTIEVHEPRTARYPQMCSVFQHPSPEYVREVARQLLTGERRAYVQPFLNAHDRAERSTAWHRTTVYFVKVWQWGTGDMPHSSTVLRLDRPLPELASVPRWPLVNPGAWPVTDASVVETDLEDVPWLRRAPDDTP